MITADGHPYLTDEVPHLTAAERAELVAKLAMCWNDWRTLDATDHVAMDEVFGFLETVFFHPPPEPIAA